MDSTFLEKLLEISRHMAATRELDPLLHYVMDAALEMSDAERGYLVLFAEDGTLDFRIRRDKTGRLSENPESNISYSIFDQAVKSGKPLILVDAITDPTFSISESVQSLHLRSVMCVPMVAGGAQIGLLYIENRSEADMFSEDDLRPLTVFASQAAIYIQNARLNDELEARVVERTAELERAMKRLENTWLEAVEANRLRTLMLGNITHDIRSPLSIVVGSLAMLQEGAFGALTPEQVEWVDRSLNAIQHTVNLMNDFFDLTKLELGGLHIAPESVDLESYLRSIYAIGEAIPWAEGVRFELELAPNLPTTWLDKTRIQQVVLNLLYNAQKYTDRGKVTLHAALAEDGQHVIIGVRDTGPGIPVEDCERIFERFEQSNYEKKRNPHGSGLGLAICRELVARHQGQIWVESVLGVGSDFCFALPVSHP